MTQRGSASWARRARRVRRLLFETLAELESLRPPRRRSQRPDLTRFVILSAEGRTGSTLLHSALEQHPEVHVANEAFCHTSLARYSYAYRPYRRLSGAAFLEVLVSKARARSRAFGFKLLGSHVTTSAQVVNPEVDTVWSGLRDQGWKIVWLFRRNLFEQVCSLGTAIESGVWQRWQDGGVTHFRAAADRPSFDGLEHDGEWFEQRMRVIDESNEALRQRLASCESMTIYYEDLNDSFLDTLFRVQDFLGVERREASQSTLKLHHDHRELVKSFEQVRVHFESTPYEGFFRTAGTEPGPASRST